MLKKEITYTNFNDEEVTVSEYFNLTKTQAMRYVSANGGMDKYVQKLLDEKDNNKFIDFIEDLVWKAYGKRDPENPEVFDTSEEAKDAFTKTLAYDELVYELLSKEGAFVDFFTGIMPKDIREQMQEQMAKNPQLKSNV